jgi:hypothetical protein
MNPVGCLPVGYYPTGLTPLVKSPVGLIQRAEHTPKYKKHKKC